MKQAPKYSLKRLAWLSLGLTCVALGALGAVLPLLPTTVFLLIAAFAFARSSPQLHNWLLNHKVFGPLIHNWQRHKAINPKAKGASLISMIVVVGLSWLLAVPMWVLGVQIIVLGLVASFILTRPNPPHE